MSASIFSPDGKNFCQFMTPHSPKPRFWAKFHLGMVVVVFDLPPDPGPGPTWTRHGPNLDQARAQPGPRTGPTWTRDRAQSGPRPGVANPLLRKKNPKDFFFWVGGSPRIWIPGSPRLGISGLTPLPKQKFPRNLFSGEGVADPLPRKRNPGNFYSEAEKKF